MLATMPKSDRVSRRCQRQRYWSGTPAGVRRNPGRDVQKSAYIWRFFADVQYGPTLYAGYFAMALGRDLYGLWEVDRDGGYYATATAEFDGELIMDLGQLVGLTASEYESWATDGGYGVKVSYCKDEKVLVPNTIYAAYNGHYSILGQWFTHYNLQRLTYWVKGYKVISHNDRPSASVMSGMLSAMWNVKALQGFFYFGHGGVWGGHFWTWRGLAGHWGYYRFGNTFWAAISKTQ